MNHGDDEGSVEVTAIDDMGVRHDPVEIPIAARQTRHFNSADLEMGNDSKGLSHGIGSGTGDWRLLVDGDDLCCLEVLAYIRTADGFLTSMHDVARPSCEYGLVPTFNPASNVNQVSKLRLINPNDEPASITIMGVDDGGDQPDPVTVDLEPGHARTFSARDLEEGSAEVGGALGDGTGKWQLYVESTVPVVAMSLLESATGHLTNLSSSISDRNDVPPGHGDDGCRAVVAGFGDCRPADDSNYCPDAEHLPDADCPQGEPAWHVYFDDQSWQGEIADLVENGIDERTTIHLRANAAYWPTDWDSYHHWRVERGAWHNHGWDGRIADQVTDIMYRAPPVGADTTETITVTREGRGFCSTTTIEFTINDTD